MRKYNLLTYGPEPNRTEQSMNTYEINARNEVIPYASGRKCTDTREWRDATELELQQQDQIKKLETELAAMTKQRDDLAENRAEWIESAERGRRKIDAQAERIRYLEGATNHANGTPLTKAIEQRDRLAMALQELCIALMTANPLDITELLNKAGDALQPLTTPTQTETK